MQSPVAPVFYWKIVRMALVELRGNLNTELKVLKEVSMKFTRCLLLWNVLTLPFSMQEAIAQAPTGNVPVAWWKFDEMKGGQTTESVSGHQDAIQNQYAWVTGVSGGALNFDGFTTLIEQSAGETPKLHGALTIETWVALQSYPWNWVALVDQHQSEDAGFYFGIDAEGRLGLEVSVWGKWEICKSEVRIPLRQWTHVVGVYDPATGIHLYLDGKAEGELPVVGDFTPPRSDTPLRIGRNLRDLAPVGLVRPKASYPALYSLDGILDELKIFDRALSPDQVENEFRVATPTAAPDLPTRHWPILPAQSARLNAAYTSLKLYPQWDALWRTGPASDVVVSFKQMPVHLVFWRGANFGPSLVTENGLWVGDQSFEASTKVGTAEHMNDKHDVHAYISIVEDSDARIVLHWHYLLVDVLGNISDVDPDTGWGDIADEYFYVYPDGVAVRDGTIRGTRSHYSFTEPSILLEPGMKPEDAISLDAVTVSNSDGEKRTYSWDPISPPFPFPNQPTGANVAMLNLKSEYKPFYIYPPGTELGPYGWPPELRPRYSHFPVWDHWPVNQIPSDGRFALFPDHFASAAVMSPNVNATWINGPGPTKQTMFLFGLTNKPINDLALLDRSWLHAPQIRVTTENAAISYDRAQKAYVGAYIASSGPTDRKLDFTLLASEESPVYNPAFVINDWGEAPVSIRIDGKLLAEDQFRLGYRRRLEGTDLVLWLQCESTKPVTVSIQSRR